MRQVDPKRKSARPGLWLALTALVFVAGGLFVVLGEGDSKAAAEHPASALEPEGRRDALPPVVGEVDAAAPEPGSRSAVGLSGETTDPNVEQDELLLRGRVVDSADLPLHGVAVALLRRPSSGATSLDLEYGKLEERLSVTESDGNGEFSFDVAPGHAYILRAPEEGHTQYGRTAVAGCRGGAEVVLRLAPSAVLVGEVVESGSGAPVPGAAVRMWTFSGDESVVRPECETDHEGRFRLDRLTPARYTLSIIPREHRSPSWMSIEVTAGETIERRIKVELGFTLSGTVTDEQSGLPIAGAIVGEGWVMRHSTLTDEGGEYVLRGMGGEGIDDVHVRAEGYGRREAVRPEPINGEAQLDFQLTPGRRARGRVLDFGGEPLGGVYVAAVASDFQGELQPIDWQSTRSGAEGSFEIEGLRRDLAHILLLRADGCATLIYDFPANERELDVVELGDFRMQPPGRIRGRALDAGGGPIADARVSCKGSNADRHRLGPGGQSDIESYLREFEARSDQNGVFHFPGLAAGRWSVSAGASGREGNPVQGLTLAEGELRDGIELVFPGGPSLSGLLVNPLGEGVSGVFLHSSSEEAGRRSGPSTITKTDGSFLLEGLGEGFYTINVWAPSDYNENAPPERRLAATSFTGLRAGAQDLRLELPFVTTVGGTIVDAEGEPVSKAFVYAFVGDRQVDWSVSSSDGSFTMNVPVDSLVELQAQPTVEDEDSPVGRNPHPDASLLVKVSGVRAGSEDLIIRIPWVGEE